MLATIVHTFGHIWPFIASAVAFAIGRWAFPSEQMVLRHMSDYLAGEFQKEWQNGYQERKAEGKAQRDKFFSEQPFCKTCVSHHAPDGLVWRPCTKKDDLLKRAYDASFLPTTSHPTAILPPVPERQAQEQAPELRGDLTAETTYLDGHTETVQISDYAVPHVFQTAEQLEPLPEPFAVVPPEHHFEVSADNQLAEDELFDGLTRALEADLQDRDLLAKNAETRIQEAHARLFAGLAPSEFGPYESDPSKTNWGEVKLTTSKAGAYITYNEDQMRMAIQEREELAQAAGYASWDDMLNYSTQMAPIRRTGQQIRQTGLSLTNNQCYEADKCVMDPGCPLFAANCQHTELQERASRPSDWLRGRMAEAEHELHRFRTDQAAARIGQSDRIDQLAAEYYQQLVGVS